MIEPQLIENHSFTDERGYFTKLFDGLKSDFRIQQVNCVTTNKKATFRGLHAQKSPNRESKVFSVVDGSIQLVCVNLEYKHLGQYQSFSFELNNRKNAVWVPKGYATGYLTLRNTSTVLYFSDELYHPGQEEGISWDDPALKLDFQIAPQHVSEKDRQWPNL